MSGLRDMKKARTRRLIADTAAELFATHGYEKVTVGEIARAAEVAEQTLYNYFPTKQQLVTDDEQQIQQRLCELIRQRPAGSTPAAAVRDFVLEMVSAMRGMPVEAARGTIGSLAAVSPAVRGFVLEMVDRQADALTAAIGETSTLAPEIARLQGVALAGVFQIIIGESGRRIHEGLSPPEIADLLLPVAASLLDELDGWFSRTGSGR